MKPFRLKITGTELVPRDVLIERAKANAHFPRVERCAKHSRRLAVVGGGPLVVHDLEELRAWDGDVWGINTTATWLNQNGVRATLFTVDPLPMTIQAPDAILASVCDPMLFEQFAGRVRMYDMLQTHADGMGHGSFTSTSAPALSLFLGYTDVSFFGCESSYDGQDHVDRHENPPDEVIVRAGGRDYRTTPALLVQCEELMKIFCFDGVYHNRSGGLLKAMAENQDTWEVVGISASLKASLEAEHGPSGQYDTTYVPLGA